jgi:hypothetical protein
MTEVAMARTARQRLLVALMVSQNKQLFTVLKYSVIRVMDFYQMLLTG